MDTKYFHRFKNIASLIQNGAAQLTGNMVSNLILIINRFFFLFFGVICGSLESSFSPRFFPPKEDKTS